MRYTLTLALSPQGRGKRKESDKKKLFLCRVACNFIYYDELHALVHCPDYIERLHARCVQRWGMSWVDYLTWEKRTFDWIELFYTDSGQGEPLIMLHGFTGSSRLDWVDTGVFDRMNKCGRRLIMLDARGHGESDKPLSYS